MSRFTTRASLVALAALPVLALAACASPFESSGGERAVTISRMDPVEAAGVAARAEESAQRTMELFRRTFRHGNDVTSCFDAFELDRADLCGDDYTAHLLFDWSDCFGTSGHILIDEVRDTVPAGGQCAAPTGFSFDHTSAYDFTASLGAWGDHEAHVTVAANGTIAGDGSPREATSDVSVHALGTGSGGALAYDASVDSDWSSTWATNGTPTITTTGLSHVHLTVLQRDYTVTATGLTFREDCCHPIAGSLAVSALVASSSFQATATFGPACGDAAVDGTPVTLAPCGP